MQHAVVEFESALLLIDTTDETLPVETLAFPLVLLSAVLWPVSALVVTALVMLELLVWFIDVVWFWLMEDLLTEFDPLPVTDIT
jgi:hypothetical protein